MLSVTKRSRRAAEAAATAAAAPPDSRSILVALNEDALVRVLFAAKKAGVLEALASSSKPLSFLARSRVPLELRVSNHAEAGLVLNCKQDVGGPFSGCRLLHLQTMDPGFSTICKGVLKAARKWTALRTLQLDIRLAPWRWQDTTPLDEAAAGALCKLSTLQQLRCLELSSPALGACCAKHIGDMVQLTRLTLSSSPAAGAANLEALSRLTNLLELDIGHCLDVAPPASNAGPFCLASSLTKLVLFGDDEYPMPLGAWPQHLAGCRQLQHLEVTLGRVQHPSAHPANLVPLLAAHTPQLQHLVLRYTEGLPAMKWLLPAWQPQGVAGAQAQALLHHLPWRPDASLAALTGLRSLDAGGDLMVACAQDWKHLAALVHLTHLAGVRITSPPPQQACELLSLERLTDCNVVLTGRGVVGLLVACPAVQVVDLMVSQRHAAYPLPDQAVGVVLQPHPTLRKFRLSVCYNWGSPAAAAVQFAAVAPILAHVADLEVCGWPRGSYSTAGGRLPDLSPCSAVTGLSFSCAKGNTCMRPCNHCALMLPEQEEFLSMLAPLVQLQRLQLSYVPRLDARMVLPLQYMLPALRLVTLMGCSRLLPVPGAAPCIQQQQQQQQKQRQEEADELRALDRVKQLLRPSLVLKVL